ncbi:MAG: Na(+)-translocating NADH-quinone reductase subunit C [Planctomycetes bacterium ADurb.Bin401]|nr:MAG: Na(+)-translocating NADH-quinone reductase subunit C [Planctomycetes bacterium ADurb.Bin401]
MTEKKWYPVLYMFLITAFFSAIVIGLNQATSKRVQANQTLIFEKAVLSVLPNVYDPNQKLSGIEVHNLFVEKVQPPSSQTAGAYTTAENGKISAYALPFQGQGFWAEIKIVIGIAADKKTILGLAVYQQNETPGLGAEITKPEFRNQFEGKIIAQPPTMISFARPGSTLNESSVHAITGATQTSVRLEKIINEGLQKWQQEVQ